jgi:phosphoenolpyruvate carboxykinase (diphosphate)
MQTTQSIFYTPCAAPAASRDDLVRYANLKLASLGQPMHPSVTDPRFLELAGPLLRNFHQKDRLLANRLCPVDTRIAQFLDRYLAEDLPAGVPRLPAATFTLDRPGLARVLSLPARGDSFVSRHVRSYRVAQGVLHNPSRDRRTTQGLFHIVEGGFRIPDDKAAIPKQAFGRMLAAALNPPADDLILPFSSDQEQPARLFVSLLLRPLVCPATGVDPDKTMEIHFFAPGSLVSNLDFVESIFGNAGDPFLPENDAALDVQHWTGHTGCVMLAPHLIGIRKKELGLPRFEDATERQRRDGMCWKDEEETYNDGRPFKVTCRDLSGVIVTIITDNYFGYCKKEVKTQISFAANLFGLCEEEHAGGAIAFASYLLGQEFYAGRTVRIPEGPFEESMRLVGDRAERRPEGYALDRTYPDILYVPGDAEFSVRDSVVRWQFEGRQRSLRLRSDCEYVLPSGYRVRLEKQPSGTYWRLVGTRSDSTLCHKPCTVSGGGKSEISKSISNAILKGPVFISDYQRDMDWLDKILKADITSIYAHPQPGGRTSRPLLSPERSLGSVIKLLTPSPEYKAEYNARLREFPQTMRQLVCVVKQHYRPEWGEKWREHFSVDRIDGVPGHELKLDNQKLVGNYLRVGFEADGAWRIFKLRPDFNPAEKIQVEDDITAAVIVPRETLSHLDSEYTNPSVKLVANCEGMLFQRPDDAIHRGYDKEAESDLSGPDAFLSNFEPLTLSQAQSLAEDVIEFDKYTEPMKNLIRGAISGGETEFVVSSAHPRLVDGKPSKNPRYLQKRPDLVNQRAGYLAAMATRLHRKVPDGQPLQFPVNAVLPGRRGSPPDRKLGIPPLAVYSPIHYQELPELLMDFICSLTGKSPSTTGFGSEGALTKRPFNALPPVIDVNNALVSLAVTEYPGFTTAAGFAGPQFRVDHDVSMLAPEVWCRMTPAERDPAFLIENGFLEKVQDFTYQDRRISASRLGYRITKLFVDRFFGRIFETPDSVLTEAMLRPEQQDMAMYADGVVAIVEAQRQVALEYFQDGGVDAACPPVRAALHLMAHGNYLGMTADDPKLRALFTRESVLDSDWYRERLRSKQARDIDLWTRHVRSLSEFDQDSEIARELKIGERLADARRQLEHASSPQYLVELSGTIGADVDLGEPPEVSEGGTLQAQQPVSAGTAR